MKERSLRVAIRSSRVDELVMLVAAVTARRSLGGDLSELGLSVSQSDIEFLGASHDSESLLGRDPLGNLSAVSSVVHEEQFNFRFVSDEELLESRWEHVSGLLVLLATDLWVLDLASEATSLAAINTTLLSPRRLNMTNTHKLDSEVNWIAPQRTPPTSLASTGCRACRTTRLQRYLP